MTDKTPEQIAAGLSEAMKRALCVVLPKARTGKLANWACAVRESTAIALERRGLITKRDWNSGTLTPLGMQVRAILEQDDG